VQIALEDLDGHVAKFESEYDAVRQREDRDRGMLAAGSVDAKQLTELQRELETLERRQSSLEDSLLEVMERREELQGRQASELAAIDELQGKLAEGGRATQRAESALAPIRLSAGRTRLELDADLACTNVSVLAAGRVQAAQGLRCLPDRDRQGRVGAHRGAPTMTFALSGVWSNLVAGQGNRRVNGSRTRGALSVIVEADGGSRGNPGPAGYGSVVWSADHGAVLAESKQSIGHATNNVAEYRGLIAGLEEAAKIGATDVSVRMDSKLVVEQMSGRWKVKHPDIATLHQQAAALSARFDHITYAWIPRAENSHADRLANEAMDAAAEIEAAAQRLEVADPSSSRVDRRPAPTGSCCCATGRRVSTQRRYSGRGPALTEVGRRQACRRTVPRAEGRHRRRRHVCNVLRHRGDSGEALDSTSAGQLIETDFGAWEGLTFGEAAERDPEQHRRWLRDTSATPPDGESFDSVAERVRRAQARIINEHNGQNVLVVSHVTPIKTLLRMALDAGPGILYRLHLDLVAFHRRVLSGRCGIGAAGEPDGLPVTREGASLAPKSGPERGQLGFMTDRQRRYHPPLPRGSRSQA
jgi:ribonuclease HI/broad specificity phosphatase PhoE